MINYCRDLAPFSGSLQEPLLTQRVRVGVVNLQAGAGEEGTFLLEAFLLFQFLQVSGFLEVRSGLRVTCI